MSEKIVIIGGGLGGLVTACLLSNEGYQVTVLEKHNIIGGGLHCFEKYDRVFETGIHYVSGFQPGGVLYKIFNYLGISKNLNIMPLDENGFDVAHMGSDNKIYRMGVGKDNYIDILSKDFPTEKDNIRNYVEEIYNIANQVPLFNLRSINENLWYFNEKFVLSVGDFVSSFTDNEKLQAVLTYGNSLYAGDKYVTPVYIHALVTKFYIEGASRFIGGSQQMADAMVSFINERGGAVHCSSKVEHVDVVNKRINFVTTSDGRKFHGDMYISDIHPANLLDMIDPMQVQRSYRERLQSLDNSYSVFTVYVTFKPESFPFINHNYYYFKDYEAVWKANVYDEDSFPPGFMLTTPPVKNQGKFADKAIVNCMMNFDYVSKWGNTNSGKRGDDYKNFKKLYEAKMLSLLEKVFPGFNNCVEKVFSASPLTIRDYLGSKNGSLYGYKKDCRNIVATQITPRTKIENLLLTGQNINLHGIIGVPLSAIVTAGELVGVDHLLNRINDANLEN